MSINNLDQPNASTYDHTQPGTVIRVFCLVIILWLFFWGALTTWILYPIAGLILLVGFIFHSLRVSIDTEAIHLRFGPGLFRKSISLEDIASCRTRRNSWMYGFGIRYVFNGWMWNVSGLDAVELTCTDGRIFRIGTDEPMELESAINEAIGERT